jgi:hypothetical protein
LLSDFVLQILKNTPPWVFVLFFVLIGLGWVQTRTRTVSLARLALLPLVMLGLSLFGVVGTFGADAALLAGWAAAYALPVALGRALPVDAGLASPAGASRITVRGSWLPLALMMTIFFTRYAVAVILAFQASLRANPLFAAAIVLAYGFLSGLFPARALRAWRAAHPAG